MTVSDRRVRRAAAWAFRSQRQALGASGSNRDHARGGRERDLALPRLGQAAASPGDDAPVLLQREALPSAGGDRDHAASCLHRNDALPCGRTAVAARGDDAAVLLQRQACACSRRRSRSRRPRRRWDAALPEVRGPARRTPRRRRSRSSGARGCRRSWRRSRSRRSAQPRGRGIAPHLERREGVGAPPGDDAAVLLQRQAVRVAGGDRLHAAPRGRRHVALSVVVADAGPAAAPRHDAAVPLQRQAVQPAGGNGDDAGCGRRRDATLAEVLAEAAPGDRAARGRQRELWANWPAETATIPFLAAGGTLHCPWLSAA